MQKNPTEPYLACPNCLTKIDDSPLKMQVKARFIEEANIESQTQSNQKYSKNPEKPTACKNHFGYLNERKQKEHVPDDCFLCEKIVDCMLKSLREEQ